MKVWKKLSAVALALVMVMALCVPAFANSSVNLNDGTADNQTTWKGEAGTFADADEPQSQAKTLNLKKEITAYNVDTTTINAPTISYTYTIEPATVNTGTTVSDKTDKHSPERSVEVPVYAGPTDTSPTIADNGVVAWATTDTLNAGTDGVANYKDIAIDFSSVVFPNPGVYRYVITEALTTSGDRYAMSGVTETSTTDTTNNQVHTRYVDVYVRASVETAGDNVYVNGNTAKEWDIYGYTCFYKNQSITENTSADANDKATGAVKTIGFVAGTTDGTTGLKADSYYTFNVTVSKTVENDNYAKANHAFPFTVIFTNDTVTKNIDIRSTVSGTIDETDAFKDPVAGALSSTKGVVPLNDSESVKYIGIPCGTTVDVYETNDLTGVTYLVETVKDNDTENPVTDNSVIAGNAPSGAVAQATSGEPATKTNAYESTNMQLTTTANADDDIDHSIAITNTLLNISPTGVTLRYAPYMAMMGLGVVALPLSLRKKEELD
jgi:hypothetical protein